MTLTRAAKQYIPRRFHPQLRKLKKLVLERFRGPKSYEERIKAELSTFSVTENVHDLPPISHYWSNKHLVPMSQSLGFGNSSEMFRSYIAQLCRDRPGETCVVLSIGAGNSSTEIQIAQWLLVQNIENFQFECMDLNSDVLDRARDSVTQMGFSDRFRFHTFDVNTWQPSRQYPIILAIQCLHHFVELEVLFDKIHRALDPDGYFLTDDMIGRNGHQRWPEALKFVDQFWTELPKSYRFNNGLKYFEKRYDNVDCSSIGFEGIRAQDILPLLVERFHFDFFFAFGNVIDVFVDRVYGPNFDPDKDWDRNFIDRVHAVDVRELESGRLKPTHMYGAMMKRPSAHPKFYKHLTPEFSVRNTRL